jgi:hypothetical protein
LLAFKDEPLLRGRDTFFLFDFLLDTGHLRAVVVCGGWKRRPCFRFSPTAESETKQRANNLGGRGGKETALTLSSISISTSIYNQMRSIRTRFLRRHGAGKTKTKIKAERGPFSPNCQPQWGRRSDGKVRRSGTCKASILYRTSLPVRVLFCTTKSSDFLAAVFPFHRVAPTTYLYFDVDHVRQKRRQRGTQIRFPSKVPAPSIHQLSST